ncbi:MAG: hypothetical protein HY782_16185 [Chloroflexi bacterium]|nr:hypothetical protein [Chloroflexota bacterium]
MAEVDDWITVAIIPPWGPNALQRLWSTLNDAGIESNTYLDTETGRVLLRVHAAQVRQAQEIAVQVGP